MSKGDKPIYITYLKNDIVKSFYAFILLFWMFGKPLTGQQIYFSVYSSSSQTIEILLMDVGTCQQTAVVSNITQNFEEFVAVPGGFILADFTISTIGNFYFLDAATGDVTFLATINTSISSFHRMLLISPTEILWATGRQYYIFDLTNNTFTLLFDTGTQVSVYALYYYNGEIYSLESPTSNLDNLLYNITLTPSFSRTLVTQLLAGQNSDPIAPADYVQACDQVFGSYISTIQQFDMDNYTSSVYCSYPYDPNQFFLSSAALFDNTSGPSCNCNSDAGTWDWSQLNFNIYNYFSTCIGNTLVLPHNGDQSPGSGQNLSFALIDQNAIYLEHYYDFFQPPYLIHIYDSPNLTFIPGVTQPNTAYLVIPIVSDAPPGSINLADPCRDLQHPITVVWRSPVVYFDADNNSNCTPGCKTVDVSFQGTAPYQLSYSIDFADGNPPQSFTQTFNNNQGTIQVCPPANFSGTIQINATAINDGEGCSCD